MKAVLLGNIVRVIKLEFPDDSTFHLDCYFHRREADKAFMCPLADEEKREELASSIVGVRFSGTMYITQDIQGKYELVSEKIFNEKYLVLKD